MKCVYSLPVILPQTFFYLANKDVAHYQVYITPQLAHIVSYLNTLHTLTSTLVMILPNIILPRKLQLSQLVSSLQADRLKFE